MFVITGQNCCFTVALVVYILYTYYDYTDLNLTKTLAGRQIRELLVIV